MSEEQYNLLWQELRDTQKQLDALEREIQHKELSFFKWGLTVTGCVAFVLATWAWSQIGHIFDVGAGK